VDLLPRRLLELGPALVGATGGSGTRVVAQILQTSGAYIGTDLNESRDALGFAQFSDWWVNRFTHARSETPPTVLDAAMLHDLRQVLAAHLADLDEPRRWGWKEPRSIFLLPFFARHLPSLRFLHVVRDGRDMALSANQNQLRAHGSAVGLRGRDGPLASITLWSWLNRETARYGQEVLGDRYLRIRFEDLCENPPTVAGELLRFFGLPADPGASLAEVTPPTTLGRWRAADPSLVLAMEEIAAPELAAFGYELRHADAQREAVEDEPNATVAGLVEPRHC